MVVATEVVAVSCTVVLGATVVVTGSVVDAVVTSSGRCVSSESLIKNGIAIAALTKTTAVAIRSSFFLVAAGGCSSEGSVP